MADTLRFSPDGRRLAFVSNRGDHSFIGVYGFADKKLRWIDASLNFDLDPCWSADGTRLAFLRLPATHDEVGLLAHRTGYPWSIRVTAFIGDTPAAASEIYRAPLGAGSVFHPLSSTPQLVWSGEQLVFPAENDGWLHLYAVPASGGAARLLTPGEFEIEYASASADGGSIVFASNAKDMARRHPWRLDPARGGVEPLTPGAGIKTQPALLSDGTSVYRSGIGYGLDYREADAERSAGASEYNDVLAAAAYLQQRGDVDADRIGLSGGSYGGYLTALGLARNSDLFAACVDLHGVHDWHHWTLGERDNQPLYVMDAPPDLLAQAGSASPMAAIAKWRRPAERHRKVHTQPDYAS